MTPSERKQFRDELQWAQDALQWAYDNCDENSDLFEAISDARLMFMQARQSMLKMLDDAEIERFLRDE